MADNRQLATVNRSRAVDKMDELTRQSRLLDRIRQSWFPPAAVVGAFGAFVAAAFRARPEPRLPPPTPEKAKPAGSPFTVIQPAASQRTFDLQYAVSAVLGNEAAGGLFRRSLMDIAPAPGEKILALGDDEVRVLSADGTAVRSWKAPQNAGCLAAGPDGRVYVGAEQRVEVFTADGTRIGGFTTGEPDKPADITAIRIAGKEILIADSAARLIRRCDATGKQVGLIGTQNKTGSFMLPNRYLDIDVDARGAVYATDTGRHRVTIWTLDGAPLRAFGKFGMTNPEDFVGCCNPVNLAVAPDGNIVTGEKMVARVKVYSPDGKLLAVIGPENFDPVCTHIHLAVDQRGRVFAADPVRRVIKIFAQVVKSGEVGPGDRIQGTAGGAEQGSERV
jgi:hypothetical protein